jgi:GR25 family glycosyltransferase involved in LPS biosynthesis
MKINLNEIVTLWYGGIKKHRLEIIENTITSLNLNAKHIPTIISDAAVGFVRLGCSASHKNALEESLNYSGPVLILEDDASPTEWYSNTIDIPDDADAFYVGTCLNGISPHWEKMGPDEGCCGQLEVLQRHESFYKISKMLTTHAILYISEKYKTDCYNLLQENNGSRYLDVLFASKMHNYNVYAPKYPLFYQNCKDDNYDAYINTITPLIHVLK